MVGCLVCLLEAVESEKYSGVEEEEVIEDELLDASEHAYTEDEEGEDICCEEEDHRKLAVRELADSLENENDR